MKASTENKIFNTVVVLFFVMIAVIIIRAEILGGVKHTSTPPQPVAVVEQTITVDDVVNLAGCDYFIVKNIDTWAVLEEDVYMDREVVEINICDDVENTLCLFIKLDPNEKERIRKN